MPSNPSIHVKQLARRYGLRTIVRDITMELSAGDVVAVTGRNGSGKSTLLRMLADVLGPTEGSIVYRINDIDLSRDDLRQHTGFVAPYLQLYTEFTAAEHIEIVQALRGVSTDTAWVQQLFETLGLADRKDDYLTDYSSGMVQRVRYICALAHKPAFLFLDEPTTNLDTRGIGSVQALIRDGASDRITVIATNEAEDLAVCNKRLQLEM